MSTEILTSLALEVSIEEWPLKWPFQITGHVFTASKVVVVRLSDGRFSGRGEAAGVYYRGDTPERLAAAIDAVRPRIEAGLDRVQLARLLPPGGARNALDCALWDLEAHRTGRPVWELAGLSPPRALVTNWTISAGTPEVMASTAIDYAQALAIKLKLLGDGLDAARVSAVRAARPDVVLAVDANQGFTRQGLDALWPVLLDSRVSLVEQPYPVGAEHLLDGSPRPIPVAADESVQGLADIPALVGRFDMINIKLDKCGGLTEALQMARAARELGLGVMVGNMTGTALAMAPGLVLGQLCDVVDLDGALFLAEDRSPGVVYADGAIRIPEALWGGVVA